MEYSQSLKLILVLCIASGCSTFRKTTLTSMAGAFAGGAVVGAASAPDGDRREMHGLLWGGVTAVLVGATMVYLHDENKTIVKKNKEIQSLKIQLNRRRDSAAEGHSTFLDNSLPKNISTLIKPGSWKIYEINHWKKLRTGEYRHSDKLLEFTAPEINIDTEQQGGIYE